MLVKATLSFAVGLPPEPVNPIHETLLAFRDAVRHVVNWCIENRVVNLAKVHGNLYYKLKENGYRRLRCPSCGFEGDRDYVAALNLRMKAFSGGLDSPQPDATPSRNEGEVARGKMPLEFFDSLMDK